NTHIGVPPSLAAMGVANAAANQLVALLCIDWLFGRYSDEPGEAYARDVVYWLGLGCLVSVAVAFDQAVVDIGFLNTGIFAGTGRASGTLTDANPYGVITALWGPACVALIAWVVGTISVME